MKSEPTTDLVGEREDLSAVRVCLESSIEHSYQRVCLLDFRQDGCDGLVAVVHANNVLFRKFARNPLD